MAILGYVILYVICIILMVVFEAYISVKFDFDVDGDVIPIIAILAIFWPVTLPVGLIIYGNYKVWTYSINHFNKRAKAKKMNDAIKREMEKEITRLNREGR